MTSSGHGLAVVLRMIWFPRGRRQDGRVVYVPISEDWMVATTPGVAHATAASLGKRRSRRTTVDTACGRRAHLLTVATDDERAIVPVWPCPSAVFDRHRCKECMETTGRKCPHRMWREVSFAEVPA